VNHRRKRRWGVVAIRTALYISEFMLGLSAALFVLTLLLTAYLEARFG
jgi:hypothetical protein